MNDIVGDARRAAAGSVEVISREELARCPHWESAFSGQRKDRRYYEIVEATILQGFDYRYFVIRDERGDVCAVQPFFLLDQDILAGTGRGIRAVAEIVRRLWPRFMRLRTLMVGCAAGEGHLDAADEPSRRSQAQRLASAILRHARAAGAPLIVLKEFPAVYRDALACFIRAGFTRVPSFPNTSLAIDYASFDDYMTRALSSKTRKDLRKKFRAAERSAPIELTIVDDVRSIVDDIYPLYLKVYERSKLRFEKLTKAYFCGLGRRMPDKVRFFVWRRNGRAIAFSVCLLEGDAIYGEYLGLDYSVALDLHLYHYVFRDVVTWAIAHGYKRFRSTGLNYDPKLHLRHRLDPLDLYVRHTSGLLNAILKRALPLLEPTRNDRTLRQFPNYDELWGGS